MCGRRCARLSEGVSSCSGCSECEEKSEISGGQEERREVGRGEMDRQY